MCGLHYRLDNAGGSMRVLPKDVFDTLELTCLVFHGIGPASYYFGDAPLCYVGHLAAAQAIPSVSVREPFGITETDNDEAVYAINRRKKVNRNLRVSWEEYCRELNIVRGDS